MSTPKEQFDQLAQIDLRLGRALQGFRNLEEFREYDRMSHDTATLYKTLEELTELNKQLVSLLMDQTFNQVKQENPLL